MLEAGVRLNALSTPILLISLKDYLTNKLKNNRSVAHLFLFLLEPLQNPLISTPSFFCKHASTFINAVQDGFIAIGKEVPGKNFVLQFEFFSGK